MPTTETRPLASSETEATAAAERLAAWVIGVPTAIVIAGLVKAKQLATHLSLRLDRVYELARTGRIPRVRTGKRAMRFDVEAVRKALAS